MYFHYANQVDVSGTRYVSPDFFFILRSDLRIMVVSRILLEGTELSFNS